MSSHSRPLLRSAPAAADRLVKSRTFAYPWDWVTFWAKAGQEINLPLLWWGCSCLPDWLAITTVDKGAAVDELSAADICAFTPRLLELCLGSWRVAGSGSRLQGATAGCAGLRSSSCSQKQASSLHDR